MPQAAATPKKKTGTGTAPAQNTQNISAYIQPIYTHINSVVSILNTIPLKIYGGTMDLTTSVSDSLYDFGDKICGKDSKPDQNLTKAHFEYIEKMRNATPEMYEKMAQFGKELRKVKAKDRRVKCEFFYSQLLF